MNDIAIKIDQVSKEYRLGAIGGATLREDVNRWLAKLRGKEDPYQRIDARKVTHNERFLALDKVSLEVHKGERLGIIGHNGAGKSTLLKILSRVTAPTAGIISYQGRISSMLEVGTGFHGELTGRENVFMNGAILGMRKKEIEEKFDDIVAFAEMEQFIDTPVKRYSSGMYVKLAFAIAAHLDNDILVMDEVLAVGDMKFQQKCLGKMSDVSSEEGKTVLYVSHNMNTIRQLCDRCLVLSQGKVIFDGNVEEGIATYDEKNPDEQQTFYDFTDLPRDAICNLKAKLQSLQVKNQNCEVVDDESLCLHLELDCNESIKNVFLRITIQDTLGGAIGIFNHTQPWNFSPGNNEREIGLNCHPLLPGQYTLRLVLYQAYNNAVNVLDMIKNTGRFTRTSAPQRFNTELSRQLHGFIDFGKFA